MQRTISWLLGFLVLVRFVCDLLRLAGEPVTLRSVRCFLLCLPRLRADLLSDAWRRSYAGACMDRAAVNARGTADEPLFNLLAEFFLDYSPTRRTPPLEKVIDLCNAACRVLNLNGETP